MVVYLDIETEPTDHAVRLPTLALAGYCVDGGPVEFTTDVEKVRQLFSPRWHTVCHRGAFEAGVLELPRNLVPCDTAIRGTILGAQEGDHDAAGHSLELLAARAGMAPWKAPAGYKKTELTLSFRPGMAFSDAQYSYLRSDVEATRRVFQAQGGLNVTIPDEQRQAAWARDVFTVARTGVHIDLPRLQGLMSKAVRRQNELEDSLRAIGIIQARGPKKDPWRKSAVSQKTVQRLLAESGALRLGSKGTGAMLARDSEALRQSGNGHLRILADYEECGKWLSLLEGYNAPGGTIRTRYNSLVTTGRMSSSAPNVQQVPGRGGLRECWVPSAGHALVEADFKALELYTFSDTCARWGLTSRIGQALNEGKDVHQVIADAAGLPRKVAKVLNFMALGGGGPATMQANIFKQTDLRPTLDEVKLMMRRWKEAVPEFYEYRDYCTRDERGDNYYVTNPQSGRSRLAPYCASLNFGFQSPGSDVIKRATELCVQSGVPAVALIHDQILCDVPVADVPEVSVLLPRLMRQAGEEICDRMRWPLPEVHVYNERWESKK